MEIVLRRAGIFENHTLKALNIPFKKVVLTGRVKCGGTEEEIVVALGHLPSPAHYTVLVLAFRLNRL